MRKGRTPRRHRATFSQHDGTITRGQPTYKVDEDWDVVVGSLPIELLTVGGGEQLRGRQVLDKTTHIAFSEYHGARTITPEMRCVINGQTYNVVAVFDSDGLSREMRIELERQG